MSAIRLISENLKLFFTVEKSINARHCLSRIGGRLHLSSSPINSLFLPVKTSYCAAPCLSNYIIPTNLIQTSLIAPSNYILHIYRTSPVLSFEGVLTAIRLWLTTYFLFPPPPNFAVCFLLFSIFVYIVSWFRPVCAWNSGTIFISGMLIVTFYISVPHHSSILLLLFLSSIF